MVRVETIGTVLAVVAVAVEFFKEETAIVHELDMGDFSSLIAGSAAVVVVVVVVAGVVVEVLESLFS